MKYIWRASLVLAICAVSQPLQAQQKTFPNGTDGLTLYQRDADTVLSQRKTDLLANEFEGTYATFKVGMGYIGDYTAYSYDKTFRKQMDSLGFDLKPHYQTRDFRILGSGRFLKFKNRYVGYKFAFMYDGDEKVWMLRETGLTIGLPELKGNFFIGRTKAGYSAIKVMNGHSGITNERQMAVDPVPILADGIKYFGYFPKSKLFLNLGYFNDVLSKGQGFSTFAWQYVVRTGWVPVNKPEQGLLLHVAVNFQYGAPLDDKMTLKSRPESNPTPQLINTGPFATNRAISVGGEIYFNIGQFMIGSEVAQHNFYYPGNDHHFNGGDLLLSYIFTGAHRPYKTDGNIYGFVPVKKSVFKGGLGEIEGVIRFSTFDLNDKELYGGKFTRITPMINWYLTSVVRCEFIYGYGIMERFGLTGKVSFFETRLQLSIL